MPPQGGTPPFGQPPAPGNTGMVPAGQTGAQTSGTSAIRQTPPAVPSSISQYFLPVTLPVQTAVAEFEARTGQRVPPTGQIMTAYVPTLFAQNSVRYQNRTTQIYTVRQFAFVVPDLQSQGMMHWDQYQASLVDMRQVMSQPPGQSLFMELPVALLDDKRLKSLQTELVDFLYTTAKLILPHHAQFKLYSDPDMPLEQFQAQVFQMAREKRDAEVDQLNTRYGGLIEKLEDKYKRKERELQAEKLELRDRKREHMYTTGEAILSIFKGRTNYTLSRMSRATRYKRQTEADLRESREVIGELERQMGDLEREYEGKLDEINRKWERIAQDIQDYVITPFKKDISVDMFGIGWVPGYYYDLGGRPLIVPAYR